MPCTKRGYSKSVIFSLFANSKARSYGILSMSVNGQWENHWEVTYQTPLRCMGPILMTWRSFSLFKIPSRRPLVMPATFKSLVPLTIWLSVSVRFILTLGFFFFFFFFFPYHVCEPHKHPLPRLDSIRYLHLPTMSQLHEVLHRGVGFGQ